MCKLETENFEIEGRTFLDLKNTATGIVETVKGDRCE